MTTALFLYLVDKDLEEIQLIFNIYKNSKSGKASNRYHKRFSNDGKEKGATTAKPKV